MALPACQAVTPPEQPADRDGAYIFMDALGHEIIIQNPGQQGPKRVAAASGSLAHTWVLAGGKLAAATQDAFREYGADIAANSEEVVNIGLLTHLNLELIFDLDIDLIILSANIAGQVALYDLFSAAGIQAAYFSVDTFEDYLDMLNICARVTGREDLYQQRGADIATRIRAAIRRRQNQEPPAVLLLRGNASKTAARGSDTMTGRMLLDLGCVNIADKSPSLLDDLSMEIIIQEDPDYILIVPQGESEEKAMAALKNGIQSNPAWAALSAVKNGRCIVLQKELFHLKPNDRWGESYEILADILYGSET